jgi:uncharacterized membrane protein YdjX (TVP38/TMEM64 family)
MAGRVFRSAAARRNTLLAGLALAVALTAATAALWVAAPQVADPAWLRTTIAEFGPLAPVAFVVVQTVQVVVAPIPGQVLAGVGGYLFGGPLGAVYSVVGVVAGSAIAFTLARRFGRPFVERVVDPDALARFDDFLDDGGTVALFVAFLLPTFPDDVLCFIAGLSELSLRRFLLLVVVGRFPSFLLVAYAGTSLAEARLARFGLLAGTLVVLTVAVYWGRERLTRLLSA